MFSIYDGRDKFYQWDKDRKLIVKDDTITEVHFANCLCPNARVCEVYDDEGIRLVDVPNALLTEYVDIRVWGYTGEMTKHETVFEVVKRTKPDDYIYTPEEMATWEELEAQINALEARIAALEPKPIPNITFTIGGVEYEVKEGTTWRKAVNSGKIGVNYECEYCGSDYHSFYIGDMDGYGEDMVYYTYEASCIGCSYVAGNVVDEDGNRVMADDVISNGGNYLYDTNTYKVRGLNE